MKSNFLQASSYNAIDLVNQFAGLHNDGVCNGLTVSEYSPANLSVVVAAGACLSNGYFFKSDAIENIAIAANTSGYNRIDVIAVDVDNEDIIAVQGTPSSSPTAPVLTGNQLALARVLVGNNVSAINNANITDVRVMVSAEFVEYEIGADYFFFKHRSGFIFQGARVESAASSGTAYLPKAYSLRNLVVLPSIESKIGETQYYATSVREDTRALNLFTWTSWKGDLAQNLGSMMYISCGI